MNTCKICKWWGAPDEYGDYADRGQMAGPESHKICESQFVGGGGYGDLNRNTDSSLNSYETISTGPGFGCIHWEAK